MLCDSLSVLWATAGLLGSMQVHSAFLSYRGTPILMALSQVASYRYTQSRTFLFAIFLWSSQFPLISNWIGGAGLAAGYKLFSFSQLLVFISAIVSLINFLSHCGGGCERPLASVMIARESISRNYRRPSRGAHLEYPLSIFQVLAHNCLGAGIYHLLSHHNAIITNL